MLLRSFIPTPRHLNTSSTQIMASFTTLPNKTIDPHRGSSAKPRLAYRCLTIAWHETVSRSRQTPCDATSKRFVHDLKKRGCRMCGYRGSGEIWGEVEYVFQGWAIKGRVLWKYGSWPLSGLGAKRSLMRGQVVEHYQRCHHHRTVLTPQQPLRTTIRILNPQQFSTAIPTPLLVNPSAPH
ncbi:hypothetical protein BDU57DRAFT_212866 [Ampelomyces quisqualis]|uniref:Uncharacterized protein n=1 Tax=Ampelomyces quisqualis TaxID=50730 RepID=A0A6A5QMS0_AMPQU|nr:hypothetical protein BDU57DRAFT_212866 [Ampelomyces quisqualis]